MKNQVASVDRTSNVEDGIEVGQDNLGMDSVDEENATTQAKHAGIYFIINFEPRYVLNLFEIHFTEILWLELHDT